MEELRKLFHQDLAVARDQLVRLAAWVTELIPRVTEVLLEGDLEGAELIIACLLYTSPSPRDRTRSRMPSSA